MSLVIVILRFLAHIPAFWLAAESVKMYQNIRRYPDLIQDAPGGVNLKVSLHLLAIAVRNFDFDIIDDD